MHKVFNFLLLIAVFVLGFFAATETFKRIEANSASTNQKAGCDESCQKEIKDQVSQALAKLSGTPAPSSVPGTARPAPKAASSAKLTQFISLDGGFATKSTDWVDVPGTDVTFNLTKDYSGAAEVEWQASLNVADGNGQAFARLFDATHGIAVDGSQITTKNNASYQTVYSGKLNLWSGSNNYRVQIKSLNSFNVGYAGGKIKISY